MLLTVAKFLPPPLLGTEPVPARQSIFGSMEMGELYLQLMVIGCDLCDFVCILDLQK